MRIRNAATLIILLVFIGTPPVSGEDGASSLDDIIDKIEARYSGPGFSARFHQISIMKAMDIKDTADGTLLIKRPNKMRWEYESPEKQFIITNGKILWVYRPRDNQVMTGKAPEYFDNGKGAGFLTDIRMIRNKFNVSKAPDSDPRFHSLKMVPKEKEYDISVIYLSISKETYDVSRVTTVNAYEDETIIELSGYEFDKKPDDSLFEFEIPKGVDVLRISE